MTLPVLSIVFCLGVLLFVAGLVALLYRFLRRARAVSQATGVETFLGRMMAIDRPRLESVALSGTESEEELQAEEVWERVGGMDGVAALEKNCAVLIDLVCYVQQWYPEALPVAEQLRLEAREIQWHVERLRGAQLRGHLQAAFPDYAQRAAGTYCAMTERVLALFESCQAPGIQELRASL